MIVTINGHSFAATFADTEAAETLQDMLPLTVDMTDLHRNEKYIYLDTTLPAGADKPARMEAGQIMLYGSNCLVLFYESFSNSYGGYALIATIDDPAGLAAAVGSGTATVTFSPA